MSELLDRIQGEIRERLTASAEAVREYERLQAALAVLDAVAADATASATSAKPTGPVRGRRRQPASRGPTTRAPRGANREAALRAIGAAPAPACSPTAH